MKNILIKLVKAREVTVIIFIAMLFAFVGTVNPNFIAPGNIALTLQNSVMYILLAIGIYFVLISKEIDVSIGSTLGMSAAVSATLLRDGISLPIVILSGIMMGVLIGLFNGFGVVKLKIPSIVMTLGTNGLVRGLMIVYTKGAWVENLPDYFKEASQHKILGINSYLIAVIIIVTLLTMYLRFAKKGKYFAAIGDNSDGANLIGIPVKAYKILAFVLAGIFASLAGIVYTSQVGFVANVAGSGLEMTTIAAAVLGGVSLNGGIGSVFGASLGALLMTSINSALVFLKIPAFWNNTISGLLLVIIVSADALINRYFKNKAKQEKLLKKTHSEETVYEEKEVLS